jgi:hypothetical protein
MTMREGKHKASGRKPPNDSPRPRVPPQGGNRGALLRIERKLDWILAVIGICRECGCTEDLACMTDDGPCHWVEPGLCSACKPKG